MSVKRDHGINIEHCWGDGRILTPAQRERKRKLDRKRASHRRRQSALHIADLESRLLGLQDTQGNAEIDDSSECFNEQPEVAANDGGPAQVLQIPEEVTELAEQRTALDRTGLTSCQEIFNSVIQSASGLGPLEVCTDDDINQDAIIRGITQGWNHVESRHHFFCPLWRIIRLLDSRIFRLSGTITRFCTLRMIHRMLLCLVNAADLLSLPPWYRPRPVQKALPHPFAVDILPWPGLRERAVLNLDLTSTNRFWNDVIYCFRFVWPYPVSDAVKIDPSSRLFQFTGMYNNYVEEISMWTMDPSFFTAFPDTVDDIVPALHIEWPLHPTWWKQGVSAVKMLPLPLAEEFVQEPDNEVAVPLTTRLQSQASMR